MRISRIIYAALLISVLGGCDGFSLNRSTGAVDGNVASNQFNGTNTSANEPAAEAIDAMIGGTLAGTLDAGDKKAAYEAQYRALEFNRSGTPVAWDNPSSGNRGEVVPGPAYTINSSQCRDYTHTIFVDGQPSVNRGTACKQNEGDWRTIS